MLKWCDEPAVEDDFASSGDFGVAALLRALIKALGAQSRGFAHGHEKQHSEPRTDAIETIQLLLGCRRAGAAEHGQDSSGAAEDVAEEKLTAWMDAHRKASLQDYSRRLQN